MRTPTPSNPITFKEKVAEYGGVRAAAKATGMPYATFWDQLKKETGKGGAKILLLDIETSPNMVYAWGLFKQNLSIDHIIEAGSTLCWAARWLGDKDAPMFASVHKDTSFFMLAGHVCPAGGG